MRRVKPLQAEGVIVLIIRRSLIVLVVREIETASMPSAGRNGPRAIKSTGLRKLVDVCAFVGTDRKLSVSKARSMADHLQRLFSSRAAWTCTRRGNRASTPSDDAVGRLV